jgi:hypothetical protein
MSAMSPEDDEAMMAELRGAVAARAAVTDQARAAAKGAFAWRTIDEELMNLAHDSESAEMLVRGAQTARVLGFSGRGLTLEIELDEGQLSGQVVPGRVCRVSVVSVSGEPLTVDTDESGFFTLPLDRRGPVRFTVDVDGGTQSTLWVTL